MYCYFEKWYKNRGIYVWFAKNLLERPDMGNVLILESLK